MKNLFFIFIAIPFIFQSCDYGSKTLTNNFEVSWVNMESTRTLRYNSEGLGVGYISSVGYNSKYIICKSLDLETKAKEYYLIDMAEYQKEWGHTPERQGRYGPYSKLKLNNILDSLNQNDLKFSINFDTPEFH